MNTTEEIRREFERAMNTPSPSPRYGRLTPVKAIRRLVKAKPKQGAA